MPTLKVKVHLEGGGSGSLLKAVQISKVFVNLDIISYENKPGNAFCLVFRKKHQFFYKRDVTKIRWNKQGTLCIDILNCKGNFGGDLVDLNWRKIQGKTDW